MVAGLSTRNYRRAVESVVEGYGIEKSSVSRQFVEASSNQLRALCERRLEDLNLVVLMIDGIHFGGQVLVVAWALQKAEKSTCWECGKEHGEHHGGQRVVGRSGGPRTGSAAAVSGGAGWIEALRAGVERVFGEQVEVQRCQIHKRRNVKEYLPENCQKDYDRRMRNAYAMSNYAKAKRRYRKSSGNWKESIRALPEAWRRGWKKR